MQQFGCKYLLYLGHYLPYYRIFTIQEIHLDIQVLNLSLQCFHCSLLLGLHSKGHMGRKRINTLLFRK
ncbi:hypothetical protein AQUCO_01000713v1 [Aquilegia coerulea]|uniref:Uncharacterized protein n=1 Tax=Aquilegia coerulea TaxID=218851 RepID=A0A2G5EBT5_AQUCA|nr:hypothetical protein AQUCO_01000713v1 [Aquilegia coerulea]